MRRHLFLLPVIATVLGTVGTASIAVAGSDTDGEPLHTATTQTSIEIPDFNVQTGACAHQDPASGLCAIPFYETDNFTGDLVGQQQESGGLSVTPAFIGQAVGL